MSNTPTQLDIWLKGFPREEAEKRIGELEREIKGLRDALAMHDSFRPDEPEGDPESRPAAIRRILREQAPEPMASGAIKDIMLEREWLKPEELKYFYAAMSNMAKKNRLLRLQDGRYMLPPEKGDDMT